MFTPEKIVAALYRAAFNREPDVVGLQHFSEQLSSDPDSLQAIASAFHDSEERERHIKQSIALPDHSQHGEFAKLACQLVRDSVTHGIVVDVGARGKAGSNSFDLMKSLGWRGFLVEANPKLHEQIRREFEGTDYRLVEYAIGIHEGVMPFYIGATDDVSSLIRENAEGWGDGRGEVNVRVRRLGPLLKELDIPTNFDLLSLDIEGLDIVVLNDLISTSQYRPRYVIIEASYDFSTKSLNDVPFSDRVKFHYHIIDQTKSNLILALR